MDKVAWEELRESIHARLSQLGHLRPDRQRNGRMSAFRDVLDEMREIETEQTRELLEAFGKRSE